MYNIFSKVDPFEVLYNALALEFVYHMDEKFVNLIWWDHDRRFLKAGVMEIVIQGQLNISALGSSKIFTKLYGVAKRKLLTACDNDSRLLNSTVQSNIDREDINFMDKSELHDYFVTKKLKENALSQHQFIKKSVGFGKFGEGMKILQNICNRQQHGGIFDRHRSCYTWSRWDKILFLADVSEIDELFEKDANGNQIIRMELERIKSKKEKPFRNFVKDEGILEFDEYVKKRKADVLSGEIRFVVKWK